MTTVNLPKDISETGLQKLLGELEERPEYLHVLRSSIEELFYHNGIEIVDLSLRAQVDLLAEPNRQFKLKVGSEAKCFINIKTDKDFLLSADLKANCDPLTSEWYAYTLFEVISSEYSSKKCSNLIDAVRWCRNHIGHR